MVATCNPEEEEEETADKIPGKKKRKDTPFNDMEKRGGGAPSTIKGKACTYATGQKIMTSG